MTAATTSDRPSSARVAWPAERYEVQAIARAEMQVLSSIHGRPCFAFAPDGDHARLEQYTWPGPDRPAVRVGDAIPLTPPLGAIFAAWADDDAVERWLSLDPDLTARRRRRLRAQLAEIRSHRSRDRDGRQPGGGRRRERSRPPRVTDERPSPWRDRILHQMLVDQGPGRARPDRHRSLRVPTPSTPWERRCSTRPAGSR